MKREKHTLSRDRPGLPLLRLHQRSTLRLLRVLNNGSNHPRGPLHSLDLLLRLLFLLRLFLRLRFHSMFILKLTPLLNTHNLPALNPHNDITLAQDPLRMRNEHPRPHQLLFPLSLRFSLSLSIRSTNASSTSTPSMQRPPRPNHVPKHFMPHMRVQRRKRIVENRDGRVVVHRARDAYSLLLPAGQGYAFFADLG